jgi:GT2 family glycosyltransferase
MSDAAGTPVIVLNWNGWEDTFARLRSLREHGGGRPVWLVDNASREDRRDEAAALYPGLRAYRWDDNYGWAGGYNRVLRIALREDFEYVYLLNNDCLVTTETLQAVVDVAHTDSAAAAVGSYIAYTASPERLQFDGVPRLEGDRFVAEGLYLLTHSWPVPPEFVRRKLDRVRSSGLWSSVRRIYCPRRGSERHEGR